MKTRKQLTEELKQVVEAGSFSKYARVGNRTAVAGIPQATPIKPEPQKEEPFDNYKITADWYKGLHPKDKEHFLAHTLPHWPSSAHVVFSNLATEYHKHGLTPQDAHDIWDSVHGPLQFDDYYDYLDFKETLDWSKKHGWEPKGLKRKQFK